ncbi:hypothetical protein DMN91_012002 [Ooceraea biroi]|uniref:Protein SirB1 N-terminal domain-containing protein n=1 Tax=Ooceraea biroi TaxID=2015173 RepID=A0A3L8D820_OOCBI|nr:hypothetical protein DMN91_012002 [Ooceraea biroi]
MRQRQRSGTIDLEWLLGPLCKTSLVTSYLYISAKTNRPTAIENGFERWPSLKNVCQKEMYKGYLDFEELVKARTKCRKEIQQFVTQMSKKYYIHYHQYLNWRVSVECGSFFSFTHYMNMFIDEEELNLLLHPNETPHYLYYYLLMEELTSFLPEYSKNGHNDDLINIYYAKELLPYLKHRHLENVWQGFINRPAEQQLLEKVATFVTQWYQPEKRISYTHIERELDNLAQQVVEHLKSVNPKHPIFLASHDQFSVWKCHTIDENQWNTSDGRQILDILCKIFFCETNLNFPSVPYWQPIFRREYVLINYVLEKKTGFSASLAIIFQSVARRLGIRCDLLSFFVPSDRAWERNYWNLTNPDDEECFYIDRKLRAVILDNTNWSRIREITRCTISSDSYCRINTLELILGLSYYHVMGTLSGWLFVYNIFIDGVTYAKKRTRWFSRLLKLVKEKKGDLTFPKLYTGGQGYMPNFIPEVQKVESIIVARNGKTCTKLVRDTVSRMVSVICEKEEYTLKPKKRKAGMKFAVGMIVRIIYHNIVGAIIRWEEMNLKADEPSFYYIVLCENKKTYCVYEVSLEVVDTPEPMNIDLLGIYFCKFNDIYYLPNEMLANEYPDDVLYLAKKFS